jgi:cardiolipin synthase (CMP-forming)
MSLWYLPNVITGLRLLLVFPIVSALLRENWQLAFCLFLIGGLSDGIDGLLARYYSWTSQLGAFLDPFADKLLLIASFVTLAYLGKLPWLLTIMVVMRDIWIILGVLTHHFWIGPLQYQPVWVSKLNTILQIVLILLVLIHLGFQPLSWSLLHMLIIALYGTLVISFIQYTWIWSARVWRRIRAAYSSSAM